MDIQKASGSSKSSVRKKTSPCFNAWLFHIHMHMKTSALNTPWETFAIPPIENARAVTCCQSCKIICVCLLLSGAGSGLGLLLGGRVGVLAVSVAF
jgi:hypothetical protein